MLRSVIILGAVLHLGHSLPQFISMKDGKIGVNFGGYHAEAGLGGLLGGNSALGGLSASAGTPYGQQAGAGLGGALNGQALGGAYAGATAGGDVGASAGLYGQTANAGVTAEAGTQGQGFITKEVAVQPAVQFDDRFAGGAVIQKIKPPKKFVQVAEPQNTYVIEKQVEIPTAEVQVGVQAGGQGSQQTLISQASSETHAAPFLSIQKSFDLNLGGGYAPAATVPVAVPKYPKETHSIAVESSGVQEISPVQQTSVATSAIGKAPQVPLFNFQKSFGFNVGGGFAPTVEAAPPAAPAVAAVAGGYAAAAVPVAPRADYPIAPVEQQYSAPVFVYRKHLRPWRHHVHLRKQFTPIIYQQPEVQPVVVQKTIQPVVVQKTYQPAVVQKTYQPLAVQKTAVGYGGFSGGYQASGNGGTFFDSIFNIPISTLKAVNGLLNTKVQGGGGFAVQKSAHVHYG